MRRGRRYVGKLVPRGVFLVTKVVLKCECEENVSWKSVENGPVLTHIKFWGEQILYQSEQKKHKIVHQTCQR